MSGKIGAFIAGGAIGAVVALLYAPRTGEESRALVADKANEAWGATQRYGAEAQVRGQQIYNDVTTKGHAAYENASTSAQHAYDNMSVGAQDAFNAAQARVENVRGNVKPVFTEKNDELRDKIEAARQRIATQVAKNAEVAHDVMNEKIPVAADAAVEAVAQVHDAVDAAAQKIAGKPEETPAAEAVAGEPTAEEKVQD